MVWPTDWSKSLAYHLEMNPDGAGPGEKPRAIAGRQRPKAKAKRLIGVTVKKHSRGSEPESKNEA